jgi:hypothetical protein
MVGPSDAVDHAAERRVVALRAKLRSLIDEATAWSAIRMDATLAQHRSQIEEVTGGLLEMHADVAADLEDAERKNALTSKVLEQLERRILAALHIWEFYRSKFSLRIASNSASRSRWWTSWPGGRTGQRATWR